MSNKILWPCQNILTLIIKEIFNPPLSPFFFFSLSKILLSQIEGINSRSWKIHQGSTCSPWCGPEFGPSLLPTWNLQKRNQLLQADVQQNWKTSPNSTPFHVQNPKQVNNFPKVFFCSYTILWKDFSKQYIITCWISVQIF